MTTATLLPAELFPESAAHPLEPGVGTDDVLMVAWESPEGVILCRPEGSPEFQLWTEIHRVLTAELDRRGLVH